MTTATKIMSDAQLKSFRENGVVQVPGVVSKAQCDATIAAIMDFIDGSLDDPESWYRPPVSPVALIEFFHHQTLWDNRTNPLVHQVFSELYGTERLWVDINRVSLRPPPTPEHPAYNLPGFIHWDIDTTSDRDMVPLDGPPTSMQGVLYLNDVEGPEGPFHCIPELYRDLATFVAERPEGSDPHAPSLSGTGYTPTAFPGKAGDLIVFDNRVPHGAERSTSTRPRFAQYIVMSPERSHDADEVAARRSCYENRTTPPNGWGDPREREKASPSAHLTDLGRKLLGLDSW